MEFQRLNEKKNIYEKGKSSIDKVTLSTYEKDFELTYTHNSTAIEGNTLTLMETKVILEDGISVGGKELREIYEVTNHRKAYSYVKECIAKGLELNESIVKDIHAILTENIIVGGIYRNQEVRITGAAHRPPSGSEMYVQIKNFYADMPYKKELNAIELAAWTHAEFVRIHPFIDGNGRTSRLLMNYQLMRNGFLPISIAKEDRLSYYNVLEDYAVNQNIEPFVEMIAELEEAQLEDYIRLIRV
ncbi:Fic family protein [Extibacter muris]|uniref:Fic family protein n=1 Tax=Extibacter muris TaxID=1796622 RepID=UPI001D099E4B|nr:Fic family protein [Extibacter muris]MCB6203442.1 Fic family protein [Extibacter muris]MCQ4665018.1 Fic family protein [Extibacter muris]MCQ4694383.1 Fic family protein [Extibacter muris]